MLEIVLNGKKQLLNVNSINIYQLFDYLNIAAEGRVVELNREIISKFDYDRILRQNDEVEIIQFMGGGS